MTANKRVRSMLPLLLAVILLLSLGIVLAEGEQLSRSLISSGGSITMDSGLVLHSATGQPAAGTVQNERLLCSGYWCGAGVSETDPPAEYPFHLYLPAFNS